MAYEKQTWQDNVSVLSAARFNHMETGIDDGVKSLRIPDITIETGVSHGDFIYPVVANDQEIWKLDDSAEKISGRFICGEVNANTADAVRMGIMAMPAALIASLSQAEIDARYSLYVQSDGKLGLGVTGIHAGFILSASEMAVDFNPVNQNAKDYLTNMAIFFAMTSGPTQNRLKIVNNDADAIMIRRSSVSAYAGSGITWGDLVEEITDWSGCDGPNEWYTDDNGGAGLTNAALYYYHAFPKKAGIYNVQVSSDNDAKATAGALIADWDFEGIVGSTVYDKAGSNNLTITSMSEVAGLVGTGLEGASGYAAMSAGVNLVGKNIFGWVYVDGDTSAVLGGATDTAPHVKVEGTVISAGYYHQNYGWVVVATSVSIGWHFVRLVLTSTTAGTLYVDNAAVGAVPVWTGYTTITTIGAFWGTTRKNNSPLDQWRIASNNLTSDEWTVIFNGGAGC